MAAWEPLAVWSVTTQQIDDIIAYLWSVQPSLTTCASRSTTSSGESTRPCSSA